MGTRQPPNPAGIALLLAFISSSCVPVAYTPGTHTLPSLDGAGQVYAGFSAGTSSFDAHAAWSPIENAYLHGAASWLSDNDEPDEHFRFAEGGLGAYRQLGPSIVGSLAAAYGVGTASDAATEIDFDTPYRAERVAYGDYRRTSLQIALERLIAGDAGDLDAFGIGGAAALRVSYVAFTTLETRARESFDGGDSYDAWRIESSGPASGLFLETVVAFRAGSPPLMFDLRLGWTSPLDSTPFLSVPVSITAGIHLRIDRLL